MKKIIYLLLALFVLASCAKTKEDQVLRFAQKTIGEKPNTINAGKGDVLYEFEYPTDESRVDLMNDYKIITNGYDKILNKEHTMQRGVAVYDDSGALVGSSDVNTWETKEMTVLTEIFEPNTDRLPYKINVRVISKF